MSYPALPPVKFTCDLRGHEIDGDLVCTDGDEIAIVEIGCGYSSLFHAVGCDRSQNWDEVIDMFADSHRGHLITVEAEDHGMTEKEFFAYAADGEGDLTLNGDGLVLDLTNVHIHNVAASDVLVTAEFLPEGGLSYAEFYENMYEHDLYDEVWGPVKRAYAGRHMSRFAWVDVKYDTKGFHQDDIVLYRETYMPQQTEDGMVATSDQQLARVIGRIVEAPDPWKYEEDNPTFLMLVKMHNHSSLMFRWAKAEDLTLVEKDSLLSWFLYGKGDSQSIVLLQGHGSFSDRYIGNYLQPDGSLIHLENTSDYRDLHEHNRKAKDQGEPSQWHIDLSGKRRTLGK